MILQNGNIALAITAFLSLFSLRYIIIRLYKTRKKINANDNFVIGINTIFFIVLFFSLFFTILFLFGIEIKQFFTSISIIAAAIAILSKDYFSNAINGMILMFNSHVSIDDYVKIGDVKGKISHLSLMNVHLINEEGDLVLIPNNVLLTTQIVNYTKGDTRKAQLELPLPTAMTVDIKQTEILFLDAIKGYSHKVLLSSFSIRIINIEKDAVVIKLSIILHESSHTIEKNIRKAWLGKWAEMKQQLK
jgi:small-conductance mechanosensitive channel